MLSDLVPFTQYNVSVAGATGAGLGQFSLPLSARTLGDGEFCGVAVCQCLHLCVCAVPGAVVVGVRVEVVCPSALRLWWTPPDSQLLGGPDMATRYLLTVTRDGEASMNQTFPYDRSLMVSARTHTQDMGE